MGSAIKFIPRPIVIGFTNGIAILIASTQVKDFFGLQVDKVPGVFWLRLEALATHFKTLNYEATLLAVATVGDHPMVCRVVSNKIPGADRGAGGGNGGGGDVQAAGGDDWHRGSAAFRSGWPHLQIPVFRTDLIHGLLGPAVTVAMLGAIESLMSAVVVGPHEQ